MKTTERFAEILDQMMESNHESVEENFHSSDSKNRFSAGWETSLDPFGLSEIIGKTSVFKRPVPKYVSTFVRPAHLFNVEQKQAFEELSKWAPDLKNNFNWKELRSHYRKALLKTHPDQGGSSENFWAAKKSYDLLKLLVKS